MRLRALTLDLFGHFTDRRYDFGPATGSDFHIVYGPNEAGKTTTMEAALRLLYGFPHREPYDFRHQRKNLRLSAVLEIDGAERTFTRLPTRSGSLLDAAGQPLPETALAAHLGGLSETDYRALLCLDDETIETGGEDIANAKGDIGRLLFSAAAGVADLSAVLDQTRAEADALYRKRASSTVMAGLKKDLAEIDRQIRDTDTPPAAWRRLKQAQAEAQAAETSARAERDALQARVSQTALLRRALPRLSERDSLAALVDDDTPDRIDLSPETLARLATDRARAEADLDRLDASLAETGAALDSLVPAPEHLALAGPLAALDTLHSRHVAASLDLPKRQRTLDEALDAMARAARDLGAAPDTDPRALVASAADLAALETAREALRETARAAASEAAEVARLTERLTQAEAALAALTEDSPSDDALSDLLARHDADRLAARHASARAALQAARARLSETLAALSADNLPDRPLDPARAATLAQEDAALADQVTRLTEDATAAQEDAERARAQADRLTASGLSDDAAAEDARRARDDLWQAHRAALTDDSADAFERAMMRHDGMTTLRLAQADLLAELRRLAMTEAEATTRARHAHVRLSTAQDGRARIAAEIAEACTAVGIAPLSAALLPDWLTRHSAACDAARRLQAGQAEHADTLDRAQALLERLRPLVGLENPDLDAALDRARALAEQARGRASRKAEAARDVASLHGDLETRQTALAECEARAREARADWTALLHRLFDDALPSETLEAAPAPLHALREHDAQRQQARRQIDAMQADQQDFAAQVAQLAATVGRPAEDAGRTYDELRTLSDAAAATQTRRDDLSARRDTLAAQRAETAARLAATEQETARHAALLPGAAPDDTPEALRARLDHLRDAIARRDRLADLDRALMTDLACASLDAARALLADLTPAALDAQAATLETDLARAEAALTEATATRANAARDLAQITGDASVADLVERRATLELELEQAARDYLERDFGLRLAEEAIRRYRDSHRSGMMQATERAFAELTNGAYTRLAPRVEGSSEVLQVIDARGAAKQVGDLSKGTRFQLYLALRAAAYEQMVGSGVVLPFFCDDIFETFDEDRTRAACRLMEHIGRSGQAIYLTHHRHVIDIAEQVCTVKPTIHRI